MSKPMTADEVRAMLRRKCSEAGGQASWARKYNIAPPNLNDMLLGRRHLSPALLRALELRKEIVFYGVDNAPR